MSLHHGPADGNECSGRCNECDPVLGLLTPDAARCILEALDNETLDPYDTLSSTEVLALRTLCAETIVASLPWADDTGEYVFVTGR